MFLLSKNKKIPDVFVLLYFFPCLFISERQLNSTRRARTFVIFTAECQESLRFLIFIHREYDALRYSEKRKKRKGLGTSFRPMSFLVLSQSRYREGRARSFVFAFYLLKFQVSHIITGDPFFLSSPIEQLLPFFHGPRLDSAIPTSATRNFLTCFGPIDFDVFLQISSVTINTLVKRIIFITCPSYNT